MSEVAERLDALRAQLEALATVDTRRETFGAKRNGLWGHDYRMAPTLDDAALARLEADCGGVELPADLRAFLQRVHGGGAGPGYGLDVHGDARAAKPFPFRKSEVEARVHSGGALAFDMPEDAPADREETWPPGTGFVCLVEHGCGVTDAVVVTGELRGTLWCCDMLWRPYLDGTRWLGFLDRYEQWLDDALWRAIHREVCRAVRAGERSPHHAVIVAHEGLLAAAPAKVFPLAAQAVVAAYLGDERRAQTLLERAHAASGGAARTREHLAEAEGLVLRSLGRDPRPIA